MVTNFITRLKEKLVPRRNGSIPVQAGPLPRPARDEWFRRPAFDILQDQSEVMVRMDVPGATAGDTSVSLGSDVLAVRARVSRGPELRGAWSPIFGAEPADWYCEVEVPERVDATRARSELESGVLTIHLPKSAEVRARIPVRA